MKQSAWYTYTEEEVLKKLDVDSRRGLVPAEVAERRARYGKNIFVQEKRAGVWKTFLKQFKNPLVIILLIAGVTTLLLGEHVDSLVVFLALAINVGIGVFQERRADKAFDKLSHSQKRSATVLRGGVKKIVPASELVPGDIVFLEAGAYVPADIRLLREHELAVNEAALTGEWVAVDKEIREVKSGTPLAEQANMAWMGTLVAGGTGIGVVVHTGGETQIGAIAESLGRAEETLTPIQKNVRKLAEFLAYLIVGVVVVIFIIGITRGESLNEMLLLAVAIAVSVIPEGLPAAVTAVLAIGMERILDRNGLVRNLVAAETLGSTTVILTDKTGTLTQATMDVSDVYAGAHRTKDDITAVLTTAVTASDAFIEGTGKEAVVRGRPMEKAMVEKAFDEGVSDEVLQRNESRIDFLPFESARRFAASLNREGGVSRLSVSGAPELLLEQATHTSEGGKVVPFTDEMKQRFSDTLIEGGAEGKRFVAVGYKDTNWSTIPKVNDIKNASDALSELVFVGLIAFSDPLRDDVPEAIRIAQGAGAEIFMLTGDNRATAQSIARAAGILGAERGVIEGVDIERMTDEELREALEHKKVLARVVPRQKLRIVKLLQKRGEVVAMTGDGINDAPALRNADIGVAVGSGTEVAKEASDLVLLNNSFSIIVAAIEEGRRIMDNLKKVVTHLLSTSFHEVFIIAAAIVGGLPLPVLPVQILWVNIIQEGLLSFAFAFEPAEKGLMKRNPRSQELRTILTGDVKKLIMIAGIVTSIFSVALYLVLLFVVEMPLDELRTVMFVVLAFDALFFAVSLKRLKQPFWHGKLLNNHYLLVALSASFLLLILTLVVPPLRTLLSLVPLNLTDVLILVGVGLFNLLTIETTKRFVFRKDQRGS